MIFFYHRGTLKLFEMSTSFDVFGNELRIKDLTFFLIDFLLKRANAFLTFILDDSLSFLFLFTTFSVLEIGLTVDLTEVCCNFNFAFSQLRAWVAVVTDVFDSLPQNESANGKTCIYSYFAQPWRIE